MFYPQQFPQPQQAQPVTAINELDSFLSGLTDSERSAILTAPDFGGKLNDFLNKFLFFLLQGELGAVYIASSAARREAAEVLKLTAHKLHAESKKTAQGEVERLKEENEKLRKMVQGQGAEESKA